MASGMYIGRRIAFGFINILDAAVFTHFQPLQRITAEHWVIFHFFADAGDDTVRGKRLLAADTTKRFVFMQGAHQVALVGIGDQAC